VPEGEVQMASSDFIAALGASGQIAPPVFLAFTETRFGTGASEKL
jgi:hypothetical protein